MPITTDSLVRLKSQLLTSGIQDKNQPLFQVINLLIDGVIAAFNDINLSVGSGASGGTGGISGASVLTEGVETGSFPNSRQVIAGAGIQFNDSPGGRRVISTAIPFGMDSGEGGEEGPPGPPGLKGDTGPIGPAGSNAVSMFYAFDGEDGEDGLPGLTGPQGFTGSQGAAGPPGTPGIDGNDGERGEDSFIPGPAGSQGIQGIQGPAGPQGFDAEEPIEPMMIPGPQGPSGTAGSGGLTLTDFTQDLGTARRSGTFDITGLAGLTPGKPVLIIQTKDAISSKGSATDEPEMDQIVLTGEVIDAATIRASWFSASGSVVVGTYAFAYAVSG